MVMREFLDPTNVMKAPTLYIYKLLKIIMFSKNNDLIFATF